MAVRDSTTLATYDAYRDKELISVFQQAVKEIEALYYQALNAGNYTKANAQVQRMKAILTSMNADYKRWSELRIKQEYLKGVGYVGEVEGEPLPKSLTASSRDYKTTIQGLNNQLSLFGPVHKEAVQALIGNSAGYVDVSINGIEKNIRSTLSNLYGVDTKIELAKGMVKGNYQELRSELLKMFQQQGLVSFKDRGGKSRTAERYIDMLVRTEVSIANTQGTLNRGIEQGFTKYLVVEHIDCCSICQRYKDKIFDIEEGAVELPPYHPNCRGFIEIAVDGISTIRDDRKDTKIPKYVKPSKSFEKSLQAVNKKYPDGLSPIGNVNEAVLRDYTKKGNLALNANLRSGNLTQQDKLYMGSMDRLFANLPKEQGTLYRGASVHDNVYKSLLNRDTYYDKGYVSTSTSKNQAMSFLHGKNDVLFEIEGRGIDISKYSQFSPQKEVLINRGGMFTIVSRKEKNGALYVKLKQGV